MAEVNIDVAKEESVQVVNTKVGTSSDTASSNPTTLFAGIKGLIAWFTGTWTATRAGYIDTINTNVSTVSTNASTVNSNIGTTANTGGTTTAGTVMAKLNALLTSWTSTRAGYLDNIITYTSTNNTANSTGTLSQKSSYLISQRQASLTGIGATVYSSPSAIQLIGPNVYTCIAKFIAPVDGVYICNISASVTTQSLTGKFYKVEDFNLSSGYYVSPKRYILGCPAINQEVSYNLSSIGSQSVPLETANSLLSWNSPLFFVDSDGVNDTSNYGSYNTIIDLLAIRAKLTTSSASATSTSFNLCCKAGEFVQILGNNSSGTYYMSVTTSITYQPR